MHNEEVFSGVTYQAWRLSDLKLLTTENLEVGANHYGHVAPEEPRLGPDGAVYVQTLGCGVERITNFRGDVASDPPVSKLVWTFPGSFCGVPTIVGHFLVQSVPEMHGLIVLDISNGTAPVEVSRLKLSDGFFSHWTGWMPKTLAAGGDGEPESACRSRHAPRKNGSDCGGYGVSRCGREAGV